jgi:hypothetical protein
MNNISNILNTIAQKNRIIINKKITPLDKSNFNMINEQNIVIKQSCNNLLQNEIIKIKNSYKNDFDNYKQIYEKILNIIKSDIEYKNKYIELKNILNIKINNKKLFMGHNIQFRPILINNGILAVIEFENLDTIVLKDVNTIRINYNNYRIIGDKEKIIEMININLQKINNNYNKLF